MLTGVITLDIVVEYRKQLSLLEVDVETGTRPITMRRDGLVIRFDGERYSWTAKSGVLVISSVPPVEPKWQDNPWLHIFWSYWQWFKKIRKAFMRPWKP